MLMNLWPTQHFTFVHIYFCAYVFRFIRIITQHKIQNVQSLQTFVVQLLNEWVRANTRARIQRLSIVRNYLEQWVENARLAQISENN